MLIIHGLPCVGKSTLLAKYALLCRRRATPVPVALARGGVQELSPVDLLESWEEQLSRQKVPLPGFRKILSTFNSLRKKVDEKRTKDSLELSKAVIEVAGEVAVSMIPLVGPGARQLGSEAARAFVEWLQGFLSKRDAELYQDAIGRLPEEFLKNLAEAATHRRIVLMIDAYERMPTLEDWLRDLALRLPENVLLVISCQALPKWGDSWIGRATRFELEKMEPKDLQELVSRYYTYRSGGGTPRPQQVKEIVRFARGLPVAAKTAVELWVDHGVEHFETVRPQAVSDLVDRILAGVPAEMRSAFEVAAVLRYFNVEALQTFLGVSDPKKLYSDLRKRTIIHPHPKGLMMQDTIREVMAEELSIHKREDFRNLHKRAVQYYEDQIVHALDEEREQVLLEQLYHLVCADEAQGIERFQQMAEEQVRYRMVSRLHTLLNDVKSYPFKQEKNRLWWKYYHARLAHLKNALSEAERAYEAIGEDHHAEPKLRAYALCDWGERLAERSYLSQPGGREKAIAVITQSRKEAGDAIDDKLVMNLWNLGDVYRRLGDLPKAQEHYRQVIQYFKDRNKEYETCYLTIKVAWGLGHYGDFPATRSLYEEVKRALRALAR